MDNKENRGFIPDIKQARLRYFLYHVFPLLLLLLLLIPLYTPIINDTVVVSGCGKKERSIEIGPW